MTGAIQQEWAPSSPPGGLPAPGSPVRHGHYMMVARMVGEFERAAEQLTDLDEIPMPLLARFARALQVAEKSVLVRVLGMEEASE